MQAWLTRRGQGFADWLNAWARVFSFTGVALIGALSPSTYNKATRQVVQKQIYFTAWQILPGFALFSALFSVLIIEIMGRNANAYGLYAYALELIVRVLVLEILPLMTALFIALRTGAAINTEVALMQIQNELGALERIGIDPFRLELLPRVVSARTEIVPPTTRGSSSRRNGSMPMRSSAPSSFWICISATSVLMAAPVRSAINSAVMSGSISSTRTRTMSSSA